MNLPDHLLTELADLGRLAAKQFQLTEDGLADNQQNFQQTHHKLDEWIQTNRAISESNRDLLQLITTHTEVLAGLTTSYNSSVSSWQDLQQQLRKFEKTISDLNNSWRDLPQAQQLPPEALTWVEQQKEKVGQLIQQLESMMTVVQPQPLPGMSLNIELARRTTVHLAALSSVLLAVGSGVGFAYAQAQQPPPPLYVTEAQEPLTLEEANLIAWAKSQEGQFAKELMDWNSGVLDSLSCTEEVKRLGVTLKVQGRPASYGFCTVWVVPPKQRQFETSSDSG